MKWSVLSRKRHLDIAITKRPDYSLFKNQVLVPICSFEFSSAVRTMPLVFARAKEGLTFCGLLSLGKRQNLFVNPAGDWYGDFIPGIIAAFPFRMGSLQSGLSTLIVAEDSDWITGRAEGLPIFSDEGKETNLLERYRSLLRNIEIHFQHMRTCCSQIDELKLLKPFSFKVEQLEGPPSQVVISRHREEEGNLLEIDFPAFENLNESSFLELRKSKALEFIYAHFYSLSCVNELLKLTMHKNKQKSDWEELGTKIFDDTEGELNFNF